MPIQFMREKNKKCKSEVYELRLSKRDSTYVYGLRAPLLLLILLLIPLYAEAMRSGIARGIRLCATTIVPSVFPFMILSSIILHYSVFDSLTFLSRPFERIFRINKNGLCAFLCGSLCGFPLGAKCATEAYACGRISKDECERLIAFSSNASPAFLIVGVGNLRQSISEGLLLYFIMILSAIAVGMLFGRKKAPSRLCGALENTDFSFTRTVENAGLQTLFVCSYLLIFSALIGILQLLFSDLPILYTIALPWLEIGSACAALAKGSLSPSLSLALTAFAVSFGGLSVHLQSAGLLRGSGISMKRYYAGKLLQGAIAVLLVFLFCGLRMIKI